MYMSEAHLYMRHMYQHQVPFGAWAFAGDMCKSCTLAYLSKALAAFAAFVAQGVDNARY